MGSRLWWVFASVVAWSIARVIGAPTRSEPKAALARAPRRLELTVSTERDRVAERPPDPDEIAGALVRPYLLRA